MGDPGLFPDFSAKTLALILEAKLDMEDDEEDKRDTVMRFMLAVSKIAEREDSYAHLDIVGLGCMAEAFVYHLVDKSILVLGIPLGSSWESGHLVVGVLPPTSVFTAVAMPNAPSSQSLH